jgi:hypothetical protein
VVAVLQRAGDQRVPEGASPVFGGNSIQLDLVERLLENYLFEEPLQIFQEFGGDGNADPIPERLP